MASQAESAKDASPERKAPAPRPHFITKEEAEKIKAAKLKKLRKLRKKREAERLAKEKADEERRQAQELADQRWRDCLACLKESVPQLKQNPWLIVQEPVFIHNYLDSLTETIANLSKYKDDLDKVRVVLQDVYEAFVDLGKFAKHQPAFYIGNTHTIKRFVRLLEQVAHKGSDKALFPNVLSLLGPTFEREELYETLADHRITYSLMSFARNDWMPTPATLALLLQIFEQLSRSARLRGLFMEDPGHPKLMGLAYGTIEGLSKEQQATAQQALSLFPAPQQPDPEGKEASSGLGFTPGSASSKDSASSAPAAGSGVAASMANGRVGLGPRPQAVPSPSSDSVTAASPAENESAPMLESTPEGEPSS